MHLMHPECWLCGSPNLLFSGVCAGCGHEVWKDRTADALIFAFSVALFLLLLEGPGIPIH